MKAKKAKIEKPKCAWCGSGQVYTTKDGVRVCRVCGKRGILSRAGWTLVNDDMTKQSGA